MSTSPTARDLTNPPLTVGEVLSPAMQMQGMLLSDEWTVGELVTKRPNATGGNFSYCYHLVGKKGQRAFLKALDIKKAFRPGADLTRVIQEVTEAHNFERDILAVCEGRRMDRVVRAIGDGIAAVDDSPLGQVPYIIFEAADCDVRAHLDSMVKEGGCAWKLRAIHHIATGLKQLHGADIAHQDVKPSNVLVFEGHTKGAVCKLGDLGRASLKGLNARHDRERWPGDPLYSPPEVWYNYIPSDWNFRRINSDLYMLGSLIAFLFVGSTAAALLQVTLPLPVWPMNWRGKFEEAQPYLQHSFSSSILKVSQNINEDWLKPELSAIFGELCNPDPSRRGKPGRPVNAQSLETYVPRFDRLARRAAVEARETTKWRH